MLKLIACFLLQLSLARESGKYLSPVRLRATHRGSGNATTKCLGADDRSVFGTEFTHPEDSGIIAVSLGFQKCGTTMMSDMLKHHPDVLKVGAKELHYLAGPEPSNCLSEGSPADLQALYTNCFRGESPLSGQAVLDFTPSYGITEYRSNFKQTVQSLSKGGATFRFVAVLREPTARAVSSMGMKRKNNEGNYGSMTNEELDEVLAQKLRMRKNGGNPRFISDGEYVDSLEGWLEDFDQESLLVINNAALNDIPTWKRIYKHFGLAVPSNKEIRAALKDTNDVYTAQQAEKYKEANTEYYEASPELIKELNEHYAPYDKRLWKLLGVSPWWNTTV